MPAPAPDSVPSPCIQVCQIGEGDVCIGCGRTLDEIGGWIEASAARRRQINDDARRRLAIIRRSSRTDPS